MTPEKMLADVGRPPRGVRVQAQSGKAAGQLRLRLLRLRMQRPPYPFAHILLLCILLVIPAALIAWAVNSVPQPVWVGGLPISIYTIFLMYGVAVSAVVAAWVIHNGVRLISHVWVVLEGPTVTVNTWPRWDVKMRVVRLPDVDRFEFAPHREVGAFRGEPYYDVYALTHNGRRRLVVGGILQRERAAFTARILQRRLALWNPASDEPSETGRAERPPVPEIKKKETV